METGHLIPADRDGPAGNAFHRPARLRHRQALAAAHRQRWSERRGRRSGASLPLSSTGTKALLGPRGRIMHRRKACDRGFRRWKSAMLSDRKSPGTGSRPMATLRIDEAHQLVYRAMLTLEHDDTAASIIADHIIDSELRGLSYGGLSRAVSPASSKVRSTAPCSAPISNRCSCPPLGPGHRRQGQTWMRVAQTRTVDDTWRQICRARAP